MMQYARNDDSKERRVRALVMGQLGEQGTRV